MSLSFTLCLSAVSGRESRVSQLLVRELGRLAISHQSDGQLTARSQGSLFRLNYSHIRNTKLRAAKYLELSCQG